MCLRPWDDGLVITRRRRMWFAARPRAVLMERFEAMVKRSNPRADHLRLALAQEAARIMAEQGIDDFGLAKRKAAERLGATDIAVLPKNTEIEAALAAHHRLFEGRKHSTALSALRRTALQAMKLLDNFQPRL